MTPGELATDVLRVYEKRYEMLSYSAGAVMAELITDAIRKAQDDANTAWLAKDRERLDEARHRAHGAMRELCARAIRGMKVNSMCAEEVAREIERLEIK